MSVEIEWRDPPLQATVSRRHYGDLIRFAEALKTNPHTWARYQHPIKAKSYAGVNRLRFPGTEWTQRVRDDGQYDLYGRYVGNGEAES